MLGDASVCPDSSRYSSQVGNLIDTISRGELHPPQAFVLDVQEIPEWHEVKNTYITNRVGTSNLSIFSIDEGAQQEELALWLVDGLSVSGAVKNPQIHEPNGIRELSDLLLSYDFGCFLLESKVLSILERGILPDRIKLRQNVVGKLGKAIRQLRGGCKNLKRGYKITDEKDREIKVTATLPAHAMVLVPDLSLLDDAPEFGRKALKDFGSDAGAYLHILDPSELLRMVQSAQKIASLGKTTTPMMAFDYYLMERFKRALELDTAHFGMLLRTAENKEE